MAGEMQVRDRWRRHWENRSRQKNIGIAHVIGCIATTEKLRVYHYPQKPRLCEIGSRGLALNVNHFLSRLETFNLQVLLRCLFNWSV